jgi:hypothetical protein
MQKLIHAKNILFTMLVLFLCFVPVSTAYFTSAHSGSYFGSNTNFSIQANNSQLSTRQINQKLLDYTQQHHIGIAKRIFIEKNNQFHEENIILGNSHFIQKIDARHKRQFNFETDNNDLLTNYAVFGDKHPNQFIDYLNHLGLGVSVWNPNNLVNTIGDTIDNAHTFYYDYLVIFWVMLLGLLEIFIIFKQRKANAIKMLFQGYGKLNGYLHQIGRELRPLLIAFIVSEVILGVVVQIISPDLLRLALISSLFLNVFVMIAMLILISLVVMLFNRFSMVEILKGRGSYQLISVLAITMLGIILWTFTNVFQSNLNSNAQINYMELANRNWNQLKDYKVLGFNSLGATDAEQKRDSNFITQHFGEKQLMLSTDYPYRDNSLLVNTNYFQYQNIKLANGQRINENTFHDPFTLLTTSPISSQALKHDYSQALAIKNSDIKIIQLPKRNYYKYSTSSDDQQESFVRPEQVLVLNLHQASKISSIVSQNIVSWATQRQLFFHMKNYHRLSRLLNNLKDIEDLTLFRAQVSNQLHLAQTMLRISLGLSVVVIIICSYFTISILFAAQRKKLFIMKIMGQGFLIRYGWLYIALLAASLPGIINIILNDHHVMGMLGILGMLLGIFTIQIVINEQSNYNILKGKL